MNDDGFQNYGQGNGNKKTRYNPRYLAVAIEKGWYLIWTLICKKGGLFEAA